MADTLRGDMIAPLRNRDPALLIGVGFACVMGLLRLRPLGAPDLWWHLSVGRTVLDQGARRFPDQVGIPPRDMFVAGEWGFDVLALGLWNLGGSAALVAFAALLASACVVLVLLLTRRVAGPERPWTALAITALVAGVVGVRFFPRPHVLFLVLLPTTLLIAWIAARADPGPQRRWLIALVLTVAVWSQCHPSVVIAPVVVAGAGLPLVFGPHRGGDRQRLSPALWIAFLIVACLPLLSPYGVGLLDQLIGHSGTDSTAHIGEMHPMLAAWWWPPNGRTILGVELLALIGVVASVRARRVAIGPLLLAIFGLFMTLNTHRFRAAWAILMVPWVVDSLRGRSIVAEGRGTAVAAFVLCLLIPLNELRHADDFGLGLDAAWVPVELGEAAVEHGVSGPIFNDYDAGGYLGWALYGQARVFIDGRTPPFFTDDHFYAARAALDDAAVFRRLDAGYGFTAAVVPVDAPLAPALSDDPAWRAAWTGSRRVLFLREPASRPVPDAGVASPQPPK